MEAGRKAAGFVTDLDNLIHRMKLEDIQDRFKFSEFTKKWQDMGYYNLFDGRSSESDKADFIESCFHILVQFFRLDNVGDHGKTMCIYMLFALYSTQRCTPKRKIRLGTQDFVAMWTFAKRAYCMGVGMEQYAIFWQLYHLHAFEYPLTSTPKLLGTSDIWLPKINADEASPALENVVNKIPPQFGEELSRACTALRITHDAYRSTFQRWHDMSPPGMPLMEFESIENPAEEIDSIRRGIMERYQQQTGNAPPDEEDNSIFTRRQRIRRTAQTSLVSSYFVVDEGGQKQVPQPPKEPKKVIVRQHKPVETFIQKHLVEKQNLFPKGNRSIYPSKDLVQIANSNRVKRGRPFVVDVERRVIQKGKRGQWHVREDKLQDSDTEEEDEADKDVVQDVASSDDEKEDGVKKNIKHVIRVTRDRVRNEIERKNRMEELDQERKELEAAREQGVSQDTLALIEKEMKKKQQIIDLMGPVKVKNPNVGRPRKQDPRKEETRAKPPSKKEQKEKLQLEIEKMRKKRVTQAASRKSKLAKMTDQDEPKKKRVRRTKAQMEEARRIEGEMKAQKVFEREENARRKQAEKDAARLLKQAEKEEKKAKKLAEKEEKERKRANDHMDFYKLKVGDYMQIEDEGIVEGPVIIKITRIDETLEAIRGFIWKIMDGEVGMALYERLWMPIHEKRFDREYVFCREDFVQKVTMRKAKNGLKLSAKSAQHVAAKYPNL